MRILIIAFEAGRWGPSRLPRELRGAGFEVAALCPSDNALAMTRFVDEHFPLVDVTSARRFERRLADVMLLTKPILIIPSDERVVACLQALVRRATAGRARWLTPAMINTIVTSLGDPEHFDEMLLKTWTLRLAGKIGVRTPESREVHTVDAAVAEATRIGFPVYIKTSFSWAGLGATFCGSKIDVANAAEAALRSRSWRRVRSAIRALLNREWYPTNAPVDVQKAIVGVPAMYNCIALGGHCLAGFAGMRHRSESASGPSSVVWLGAHPRIADASNEMIAALGASGFINFDYMIEEDTDEIYLLECNPRPGQVSHLGPRVGVDLCAALARELRGEAPNESAPENRGEVIHLFPQEWIRDPRAVVGLGKNLDVPLDDPKLLNFMIAAGGAVPISDRATSENLGYPWDLQACDVTR
jgi:hypothetical protein